MITLGKLLKEKRLLKKYSRKKLGELTRIRENFIQAIEEEKWDLLPEKAVVSGFVKSIAGALDIGTNQVMALFRRDYPQKPVKLNPSPDLPSKFTWSPRVTFVLGSLMVFIVVCTYLVFQYFNFVKAPSLEVELPSEGQSFSASPILVKGFTDSDASVIVNNQPTIVSEDGIFETELEINNDTKQVEIKSKSRTGKEAVIVRNIVVKLEL